MGKGLSKATGVSQRSISSKLSVRDSDKAQKDAQRRASQTGEEGATDEPHVGPGRNLALTQITSPFVAHFMPPTFPLVGILEARDIDICHFSFESIKSGDAPGMEDRGGRSGTVYMFDIFYQKLYARCPLFRAYFKGSLRKRAQVMTRILDTVCTLPGDDPEWLAQYFDDLGVVHRDRNIRPWMYSVFCEVCIEAVLHCLGHWADYRVAGAWMQVFAAILTGMMPNAIEGHIMPSEFCGNFQGEGDPQQKRLLIPEVAPWRIWKAKLQKDDAQLALFEGAAKGVEVFDLALPRTYVPKPAAPPLPTDRGVSHIFYGVSRSQKGSAAASKKGKKKRRFGGFRGSSRSGRSGGRSSRGNSKGRGGAAATTGRGTGSRPASSHSSRTTGSATSGRAGSKNNSVRAATTGRQPNKAGSARNAVAPAPPKSGALPPIKR